MKISNNILPAMMLAGTLALAGCGGGSDDTMEPTTPTEPTPPPPTALENASDAQANALAAKSQADTLLMNAVAASKALAAHHKDVNGSSQTAKANASLVMAAEAGIMAQYEAAKTAHMAAEAAHTAAPAAQQTRIASMVMAAKDAMDAIKAILDAEDTAGTADGSLAEAVAMVKTGAKTSDTDAMIAQAKATAVAKAVAGAIAPQLPTLEGTSSAGAPAGAVTMVGEAGMTFAEIAGGSTMVTATVKGFKAAARSTADVAVEITDDGTEAHYMGIPGQLVCLPGPACTLTAATGAVAGTVHFVPNSQTTLWTQTTYGGDYTPVTNAATYGHWLTAGAVNLHAASMSTGLSWIRAATASVDKSAKYTGKAGGYSERTTGIGTAATRASGTFTADVTLNANFKESDTSSLLSGSIGNFAGGAHVDPTWHVLLQEKEYNSDARTADFIGMVEVATGTKNQAGREEATSGNWEARGYGEAGKNPSGFVGIFSAGFDNGSAAGSYQASASAN